MYLYANIQHVLIFRDCHELTLSDMKVSEVTLFNGRLFGLGNMARWGNANMDMKYDSPSFIFSHFGHFQTRLCHSQQHSFTQRPACNFWMEKKKPKVCFLTLFSCCFISSSKLQPASKQVISHYRGEIKGSITRAFLKLKMKQKVQTTSGQPVLEGDPDIGVLKIIFLFQI